MTTTTETTIDLQDVSSVYSGRPGCACGCRGKHTYASAHRGYPVTDNEVSDRTVKMMVNKMNKLISDPCNEIDYGGSYVACETCTRLYIVYLKS